MSAASSKWWMIGIAGALIADLATTIYAESASLGAAVLAGLVSLGCFTMAAAARREQ